MKKYHTVIFRSILITLVTLTVSCNDDTTPENFPEPGDYFPLQKNNRWDYVITHIYSHPNTTDVIITDTIHLYVDTLGITDSQDFPFSSFTGIYDIDLMYSVLAKKQEHQYTSLPPYYNIDQLFLVDNKPIGYSWTAKGNVVYTVIQVNGNRTVNGILYKNVIEIQEGKNIVHFYAKDIGEIYSYEKDAWSDYSNTVELTLLKHSKL